MEFTFVGASEQPVLPESSEDFLDVFPVVLRVFRVDQDVINKHNYKFIQEGLKYLIHHSHKCRWGICQSKWHHQKFKVAILGSKSSFWYILTPYFQLVVTRSKINL